MAPTGRFLLDTNIIIALLEGDETVLPNLDRATEVFIPAIAVGELFFGAEKSGRPRENTAKVERFASGRSALSCDLPVVASMGASGTASGRRVGLCRRTTFGLRRLPDFMAWFCNPRPPFSRR